MKRIEKFSPTIFVENPSKSSEFYVKYFDATIKYDCGWYIIVSIGDYELCFMKPQMSEQPIFSGDGLMYSFQIENVNAEYNRLVELGATVAMPLNDYPWGDRAFSILDSNGVSLYFYEFIVPSQEYKDFHK